MTSGLFQPKQFRLRPTGGSRQHCACAAHGVRRGRADLPLSPPSRDSHWLQRQRHLPHWPGALSVSAARHRRHGAVQEQVRRAGGAAAVSGPGPRRSRRAVPQVRAVRGGLGGPAVPPLHRGPPSGPRRQRCHRAGARGLRPGVLLHLLHRCGRHGRPPGCGVPLGPLTGACVPRSEVPERLHRDGAAAVPQGLVPAAVLRAALRAAPGEPRPALPLLPQHPARRRSAAPRAWGEHGALFELATTPWCCSGCDRHSSCLLISTAVSRSKYETGTSSSFLKPSLILLEASLHFSQKQSNKYSVTLFSF